MPMRENQADELIRAVRDLRFWLVMIALQNSLSVASLVATLLYLFGPRMW
jgi:hypothetical protein